MRWSLTPFFNSLPHPICQQCLLYLFSEYIPKSKTCHHLHCLHPLGHPSTLVLTASSLHLKDPTLRDHVKLNSSPRNPHLSRSKDKVIFVAQSPLRCGPSLTFCYHILLPAFIHSNPAILSSAVPQNFLTLNQLRFFVCTVVSTYNALSIGICVVCFLTSFRAFWDVTFSVWPSCPDKLAA